MTDWINNIQKAINYIEEHLTEKLDYCDIAKQAYSSTYHFQRIFGIICGLTLGEYIRKRRLSLAGIDLLNGNKIIDVAIKYGYETPESFSRAFQKFHEVPPSKIKKGYSLKTFPKLILETNSSKEEKMNYKIIEIPEKILVGYKKRFSGVPYGDERARQEEAFLRTTRAKQWLLIGASCDYSTDYMIVNNIDDNGYDFFVAYELDQWTRESLYNPNITGVDFIKKLGFETITIPKQTYAVFETKKKKRPISDYVDIRKQIATDWLSTSGYMFSDGPEVVAMHWRPNGEWAKERYIEIRLPIIKP